MLEAFRLIPALQLIFGTGIEFEEQSFEELTRKQKEAYVRGGGDPDEKVYRVVNFEPECIERTKDRVLMELSVVTEAEKKLLLEGVQFVRNTATEMPQPDPTFEECLAYLRSRLPPIVVGE